MTFMLKAKTAAILLAAGRGKRFGGPVRKQYLVLQGKPLLWWSLKAFNDCPFISDMILVGPSDDLLLLNRQARAWRFRKLKSIVAGGKERSDSVKEGLKRLPEGCRWVAIHDSVRCLIRPREIEAVWKAAKRYKAALAASPSRDTVKMASPDGFVHASPDRKSVWLAQTPQIFERALLERAHSQAHGAVTDDAQVVERLGQRVKLVETSTENIKVTLPFDLEIAKAIFQSRRRA
jgi:2-C-methyl-D-erythritol 4-phosphate cytidylyltransferase